MAETTKPNGSHGAGAEAAVTEDDLTIPLIDFSAFLHPSAPSDRTRAATELLDGFRTAGFLYLRNHGIPSETVSRIFELSASFFALPQDAKDALAWYSARANRGYTAMGKEKTTSLTDKEAIEALREEAPDIKESLEIGKEGEEGCPNMWPAELLGDVRAAEAFKREMREFHDTCKKLHEEVMRAIAVGMGIEEGWFDGFTDRGDNTLRLLHYPAVSKSVFQRNRKQVRAGEHSDYGSITLLFQDERGGLQVQSPKGTFVDAKPIEGTIVVNAGDLLARWSNDLIKSTIHRVVEPPAPEEGDEHPTRYSIAYFCNPNFEKWIDAIPGTISEEKQKKYEPVISGDYLVRRLTETY